MPASLGLAPVGVDDGDAGQGLGRFGVFSLRLRRHLGSVEAGVGRTIETNGGLISWNRFQVVNVAQQSNRIASMDRTERKLNKLSQDSPSY